MTDLSLVFLVAGLIILIGFLGNVTYEKVKIPDVLILLGIGIFLGPVLKLIDADRLTDFADIFGTFALIVILFEGGMDIKIRMLIQEFGNAALLVLLSFTLTTLSVVLYLFYGAGWELIPSLLMATVLGCTSSAIVVPVLSGMSLREDAKTVLYIESALSDVLAVVLAVSLMEFVEFRNIGIEKPMRAIASSFSIAIVLGTLFGIFWFKVLKIIGDRKYAYMVTLGVVLVIVSVVDFLGGSGPIAILLFGIILSNCGEISFFQREEPTLVIDETIKFFHGEVTFFIRTFFFVYMGMLVTAEALEPGNLYLSVVLMLIIMVMRYGSVEAMVRLTGKEKNDRNILFYMLPRGLASAVLASLPVSLGLKGTENFIVYAVSIIILSNILMTGGVFHLEKANSHKEPQGNC